MIVLVASDEVFTVTGDVAVLNNLSLPKCRNAPTDIASSMYH